MLLFKPGILPDGEYLYLDLDVVIVDNIDCFFDFENFGITRDFINLNKVSWTAKNIIRRSCGLRRMKDCGISLSQIKVFGSQTKSA